MQKEDFKKEKEYLDYTKKIIGDLIDAGNQRINKFDNAIHEMHKYVNTSKLDPIEIMQAYENINQNDYYEVNEKANVEKLKRLLKKPYFGKIEVQFDDETEPMYIGVKNVNKDMEYVVYDWRAPVSSLYYNAKIGPTSYIAPSGKIEVDLKSKRQFIIENGKLEGFFDTNLKINDDILQDILTKSTTSFMQNIIQTIQEEQNEIIRQNPKQDIIINGIAGSGKTSVGMHRIAYILFEEKDKLKNENFLVISPNKLFSKYISELLPELDEENVDTISFENLLKSNPFNKFVYGTKQKMNEKALIDEGFKEEIKNKLSLDYLNNLKEFLSTKNNMNYIGDLNVFNKILEASAIENYYFCTKDAYNINESIILSSERIADKLFSKKTESQQKQAETKLYNAFLEKFNFLEIVKEFLNKDIKKDISYEDIPALLYIYYSIFGYPQNNNIKHVFVDEVQDYGAIALEILRKTYPYATFVLAGDFNQNLNFKGDNKDSLLNAFPSSKIYDLEKSYRSTNEIIEFASSIFKDYVIKQNIRKGNIPVVYGCKNYAQMIEKISEFKQEGRTAIICKSVDEVLELSKNLESYKTIIDEDQIGEFSSKNILTTAYLSKGLEFDNVIIANLNSDNYYNDLDAQHLYVAATRGLHNVNGFYFGECSKFINQKYISENNIIKKKELTNPKEDLTF